MFTPTPELIAQYHRNTKMRHAFYEDSVKLYHGLECHFEGEAPKELIRTRRPAESEKVWQYREKIYESVTKPIVSRVYNSLQKIRKSPDWTVRFDANEVPPRIAESETPERYLNYGMPIYKSVTNWTFSHLLRTYLMDANAFVAVQPFQMQMPQANQYLKPVPIVYDSDDIIDYKMGEYLIALSDEEVQIVGANGKVSGKGAVYYIYTTDSVYRYVQTASRNGATNFTEDAVYVHNLGYVPVHQTYGIITDTSMEGMLAESRLQPMVPYLNEMAREYSDLQAEIVQHIHSTPWYYAAIDCTVCNGTGRLSRKEDNVKVPCGDCGGSGKKKIQFNSYEAIVLPPPQPGDTTSLPTPPAGYITKDTTIAELQDRRVDAHGYKALAAMNMQFLDSSPLNQSGVAKEVDRDELQNTVHSIAEDLVRIVDFVCESVIDMRYSALIPSQEERRKLYPVIPVPEKYDLLTSTMQVQTLQTLVTANVDQAIIKAAQVDLVNKMYSADAETKDRIILEMNLDPLNGMTPEEIASAQTFGAVSDTDAVIHYKIGPFIDRAMAENKDFMQLEKTEQMEILQGYATEQIAAGVPGNAGQEPAPNAA